MTRGLPIYKTRPRPTDRNNAGIGVKYYMFINCTKILTQGEVVGCCGEQDPPRNISELQTICREQQSCPSYTQIHSKNTQNGDKLNTIIVTYF